MGNQSIAVLRPYDTSFPLLWFFGAERSIQASCHSEPWESSRSVIRFQSQPGGEQGWDGTPKHRCLCTTRGCPAAPSSDSEPSLVPPLTGQLIPHGLTGAPSQLLLVDTELPTSLCPVFIKTAVITPTASNTASLNKPQMK